MKRLLALVCIFLLAACGGPSGKADQAVSKKATEPTWDAVAGPFVAPGWKPGDKASWQEQITKRAQGQNEYLRAQ